MTDDELRARFEQTDKAINVLISSVQDLVNVSRQHAETARRHDNDITDLKEIARLLVDSSLRTEASLDSLTKTVERYVMARRDNGNHGADGAGG